MEFSDGIVLENFGKGLYTLSDPDSTVNNRE